MQIKLPFHNMNRLSPELIDAIVVYLYDTSPPSYNLAAAFLGQSPYPTPDPFPLSHYSSVSRLWQYVIEARLFRKLSIKSTDVLELSKILSNTRRQQIVQTLECCAQLPSYSEEACGRFERANERAANNKAFTDAVHNVFKTIDSWVLEKNNGRKPFKLCLTMQSPSDVAGRGVPKVNADRLQVSLGRRHDLFLKRYKHTFIKVLNIQDLPTLNRVTHFYAYTVNGRFYDAASYAALAAKLPNVENIQWSFEDDEKRYPAFRKQLRQSKSRTFEFIELC